MAPSSASGVTFSGTTDNESDLSNLTATQGTGVLNGTPTSG